MGATTTKEKKEKKQLTKFLSSHGFRPARPLPTPPQKAQRLIQHMCVDPSHYIYLALCSESFFEMPDYGLE